MATHPHDPPERSHPLLWTLGLVVIMTILGAWFARWMAVGAAHGREAGPYPRPVATTKEPDHLALIENKSPEVLDRGAVVYANNCVSCHGPNGDGNPQNLNPPPRNFRKDTFKNPTGGGPYGIYLTLTNGFAGRMPPFLALKPEDRYAVAHYIRETMVKPSNPTVYVEKDPAAVLAKVPKKGEGDGAGPQLPPDRRPVAAPVHPLMAGLTRAAQVERAALDQWLDAAATGAQGREAEAIARLADLRGHADQVLIALRKAAVANDQKRIGALLAQPAPGVSVPHLALLSEQDLAGLTARLQRAAKAAPAQGAK